MKGNQETFKNHLRQKTRELVNKSIEKGEYKPKQKAQMITFDELGKKGRPKEG